LSSMTASITTSGSAIWRGDGTQRTTRCYQLQSSTSHCRLPNTMESIPGDVPGMFLTGMSRPSAEDVENGDIYTISLFKLRYAMLIETEFQGAQAIFPRAIIEASNPAQLVSIHEQLEAISMKRCRASRREALTYLVDHCKNWLTVKLAVHNPDYDRTEDWEPMVEDVADLDDRLVYDLLREAATVQRNRSKFLWEEDTRVPLKQKDPIGR
jgi:hypothetical protein